MARAIAGLTVAVTGAARGIGAAIAAELAAAGARVVLGDLDEIAVTATAATLPGDALAVALDVTDPASVAAFLDRAEEAFGPVDVLVNNAGVMWVGPFGAEPHAAARRQFDVNVHGVRHGFLAAAPRMRARGRGHIVTVASAASRISPPGEATYAATKHAVYGYALAARHELAGSGVQVTVVMPSVVETELAVGTSHGSVRRLTPAEVARAVLGAIRRPRFEVFVPGRLGPLTRLLALLPQGGRDLAYRLLVPDQVVLRDEAARVRYQDEAGLSERDAR
ncbi:SDR family NAD(P)-dependent oxidoreductase [Catellatospora tritici]|uniref:SDR family NAD(P)-dependent oxidoreductase n=1 Tax=Catellatospora tritici TaxID=2851566 RepID=UPI001C2D4DFC|nr:SDR family NAD(P)-dependent oxidoreductase [Catellatospora tritici]MBV1850312.1 SDR family NAD(P)-dependent oxidoreductase [Catellatospora tritici]